MARGRSLRGQAGCRCVGRGILEGKRGGGRWATGTENPPDLNLSPFGLQGQGRASFKLTRMLHHDWCCKYMDCQVHLARHCEFLLFHMFSMGEVSVSSCVLRIFSPPDHLLPIQPLPASPKQQIQAS